MRVDLSQLTSGHVSSEQNTKKVSDQQLMAPRQREDGSHDLHYGFELGRHSCK